VGKTKTEILIIYSSTPTKQASKDDNGSDDNDNDNINVDKQPVIYRDCIALHIKGVESTADS